nr:hypothetical protein [Tanacetum cinerariifolium]
PPSHTMELNVLNPFGLQAGQVCDTIRIRHLPKGAPTEDVVVALPVEGYATMQDAATAAYLHAKGTGQLSAGMMAYCSFSYRDDEADAW